MLWVKRQRKYQSLPSQQNAAGKSYTAEGMEVSIKPLYLFSGTGSAPIPENPPHFPALRPPCHTALGELESPLLPAVVSLPFPSSLPQPQRC